MIDREQGLFWLDVGSALSYGFVLCLVLLGFRLVSLTGLEAGLWGIAGLTTAIATVASLLSVRQQVTDWEIATEYPAAIRELSPLCSGAILASMVVPLFSEPRWQLVVGLPALLIAVLGTTLMLVVIYKGLTDSASTQSVDAV